ncbi:MAG: type II secretion system minor pseudopilin GspH [Parvularculaceae bacterium]
MRISATGRRSNRAAQRGVSLVEILIVLAIIAMVAGLAVASAPPGRSDARKAADKFAAVVDRAAQSVVTSGSVIGLDAQPSGYSFYLYERGAWKLAETTFPKGAFPSDVTVAIETQEPEKRNEPERKKRDDDKKTPNPAIRFAPTGETSPFTAYFQVRAERFAVTLDSAGNVMVSDAQQ